MSQQQFAELLAVVGLANETNRLVIGYWMLRSMSALTAACLPKCS